LDDRNGKSLFLRILLVRDALGFDDGLLRWCKRQVIWSATVFTYRRFKPRGSQCQAGKANAIGWGLSRPVEAHISPSAIFIGATRRLVLHDSFGSLRREDLCILPLAKASPFLWHARLRIGGGDSVSCQLRSDWGRELIKRAIPRLLGLIHRHAHPELAAPLRSVLGFIFCCLEEEVKAADRQCDSVERLSEFLRAKGPSLKLEVHRPKQQFGKWPECNTTCFLEEARCYKSNMRFKLSGLGKTT
jgi:hypothetical protein